MQSRAMRHIFSASDDTVMTKQIRATHAPIEEHVDVRPLLNVVQDIFRQAASLIPDIAQVCVTSVCVILTEYHFAFWLLLTMFMFVAVLKFHTGKASANGCHEG
jgi:hypothetical protein